MKYIQILSHSRFICRFVEQMTWNDMLHTNYLFSVEGCAIKCIMMGTEKVLAQQRILSKKKNSGIWSHFGKCFSTPSYSQVIIFENFAIFYAVLSLLNYVKCLHITLENYMTKL